MTSARPDRFKRFENRADPLDLGLTPLTNALDLVQQLLAVVQHDVSPATWNAFRRFGVEGVPARRVAEELGLSGNAVILA